MQIFQKNTHVYSQVAKALGVLFCLLSAYSWIWRMFDDPAIQEDVPSLTVNVHFTLHRLDVYCSDDRNEREPGQVKVTEVFTTLQR